MSSDVAQMHALRTRNAQLEDELGLLQGVLSLVKEDLHVKNDQVDHLYYTFLASKEHARQEQAQREHALQQRVDELQTQVLAQSRSNQRLHTSLQRTTQLLQQHERRTPTHASQLHELPAVLAFNVLSYLDTRDAVHAACAHRHLLAIVMCESFWQHMYGLRWRMSDAKMGTERLGPFALPPTSNSNNNNNSSNDNVENAVDWSARYRERHVVERNWASGRAGITTLNGHSGTVTCLQFSDTRLVSGSDDGSMMLWSLRSPDDESQSESDAASASAAPPTAMLMQQHHRQRKSVVKLHSFFGHGGPVWTLRFQNTTLMSGSYDKTVKIWDLQTGKCRFTLRGHTGWVSSLDCNATHVASASWDSTINLWDVATGALLRTLTDSPTNPIYSLQWDHRRDVLVTGCRRFGVQLWDIEAGQKIAHFAGHNTKQQLNIVKACDERILSGGSDHAVKVWDRRQRACVATLTSHRGAVMSVDYDLDHRVISGSYDSVIKLWDLRYAAAPVRTFEGHGSAVFSLQMDATKMISGSADTTIKIFRFQ